MTAKNTLIDELSAKIESAGFREIKAMERMVPLADRFRESLQLAGDFSVESDEFLDGTDLIPEQERDLAFMTAQFSEETGKLLAIGLPKNEGGGLSKSQGFRADSETFSLQLNLTPLVDDGSVGFRGVGKVSKKIGNVVVKVYRAAIRKVKDAYKAFTEWTDELKQKLYVATDKKLFDRDDKFGFKKISRGGDISDYSESEDGENFKKGRALIFIHGIFSNIRKAFGQTLWAKELHDHYPGGVYGFNHPTFSKPVFDNSIELAGLLPEGAEIDIICHSRGAVISRCLLEHPDVIKQKNLDVRKVIFVAGACKGSPLASDKFLENFLTITAVLDIIGVATLAKLFKVLAQFFHNAPGVTCLDPKDPLYTFFSERGKKEGMRGQSFSFFRANYDMKGFVNSTFEEAAVDLLAFAGMANDMVVPYANADISGDYRMFDKEIIDGLEFGSENTVQKDVCHTKFFIQESVCEKIYDILTI